MRASFFEFNVAMSGIFTAKNALNVATHNIANASNKDYSRQVALQRAGQPLTFYDGRGMVGTGSEVYGVGQIRSAYLDQKYWSEKSVLGEYSVKNQLLSLTQTIFDPLSETGLSASFDNFFNSLKDLQTNSIDDTYRGNVMQVATTLSKFINGTYESMVKQQTEINNELRTTVQAINNMGVQIRNLNEQIMKYELDGSNANDLRDQRAALVDKLSGYVNVQVKEETVEMNGRMQKQFSVQINGTDFVNHLESRSLELHKRTEKANPEDADGLYDIYWAPGNVKFNMYHPNLSGELKALIDLRDGNNREHFTGEIDSVKRFSADVVDLSPNGSSGYTIEFDVINDIKIQALLKVGDTFVINDVKCKVENIDNMPNSVDISIVDSDPAKETALMSNTPTSVITATGSTTITLSDVSRTDLLDNGKITIKDSVTGKDVEYTFDDFTVNQDGTVTINVIDMTPQTYQNYSTNTNLSAISGESTPYKGIPYYISRLNDMVRTFAKAVNEGLDYKGDPIPNMTGFIDAYDQFGDKNGYLMFTYTDESGKEVTTGPVDDYNKFNAKNFSASTLLTKKPSLVATSSTANDGESKNDVILDFSNMVNYKSLFREGTIKDYASSISTEMAIDLKQAENFDLNYTDVVMSIDYQRKAVMSVDPDEESMNIIKYNQLMQTAAKLVNVINEMYDTLINGLGA